MTARSPQAPSQAGRSSGPDLDGTITLFPYAAPHTSSPPPAPSGAGPQSRIFRQAGAGRTPTIVIAGFLPDATESIEYQRDLLARYGDIYYVNYPRDRFCTEALFSQVAALVRHLNARGEHPVLFSICFGSGLVAKLLRERVAPATMKSPPGGDAASGLGIAGVVMVSPVLCAADMVRLDGGPAPMRERAARLFFLGDRHGSIEREVVRARRAFASLFRRERVTRLLNDRNAVIIARVLAAVHEITVTGYYERALALKALTWPAAGGPIYDGPALVLLAEDEDGVFVPTSPTLAALRTPSVAAQFFPRGAIHEVASANAEDPVVHGSIVVHHRYFNPFITAWYDRLSRLTAV